jgi:CheY-like chemotaxis protein
VACRDLRTIQGCPPGPSQVRHLSGWRDDVMRNRRTAFASARDRQRALAAGYDEHVPKPLGLDARTGAADYRAICGRTVTLAK